MGQRRSTGLPLHHPWGGQTSKFNLSSQSGPALSHPGAPQVAPRLHRRSSMGSFFLLALHHLVQGLPIVPAVVPEADAPLAHTSALVGKIRLWRKRNEPKTRAAHQVLSLPTAGRKDCMSRPVRRRRIILAFGPPEADLHCVPTRISFESP